MTFKDVRSVTAANPTQAADPTERGGSGVRPWPDGAGRGLTRRQQIRSIVLYCVAAFGLAWIACSPLWFGPGLSDPVLFTICGGIAMITPAVSAVVVTRFLERRRFRTPKTTAFQSNGRGITRIGFAADLGLRVPRGPKRLISSIAIGMISPIVLVVLALAISTISGTFAFDPTLGQSSDGGVATDSVSDRWLALGGRVLLAVVVGGAINILLAMGEEVGWRGFLLPRLERLVGLPAAIIVGGVIWGLWHAPLILLGYNYPDIHPLLGQLAMIAACTTAGGFFYLLASAFRSTWPAALAHGVNNAASGLIVTSLLLPGAVVDTLNGSALGWPGWIVYGATTVVGFAILRKRRSNLAQRV